MEKIFIYHTNDLHSHFEHWAAIHSFLVEKRKAHRASGETALFFDIGDFADRSHPYIEGTKGKGIRSMLEGTYDAVTIGNNEGITFSREELIGLYENLSIPVLVNNIVDDGRVPAIFKKYTTFTTASGATIGVIGTTAMYETFYRLLGWEITDPIEAVRRTVEEIRSECSVIILLSHLGLPLDEEIAASDIGIDLILGGHTHHILHKGKEINGTVLAAGGKHGQWIGEIELTLAQDGTVTKVDPVLREVQALPVQEEDVFISHGERLLQEEVFSLRDDVSVDWFTPNRLSKVVASSMLDFTKTEIGFFNLGTLLVPLKKGAVTSFDLHQLLPHPINYVTVELTGAALQSVVHRLKDQELHQFPLKGLGFRGTVMGAFHLEGVVEAEDGTLVLASGERMLPNSVYRVSTLDVFTFGPFLEEVRDASSITYHMPEFMRDVLRSYLFARR